MPPHTAKLFMNGRSQALRLPKAYRFDTEEVYISRQGKDLLISAKRPSWDEFFDTEPVFDDEFMSDRLDTPAQDRSFD